MINHRIYLGQTTKFDKVVSVADSYISGSVTIDNLLSTPSLLSMIIEISCKMLDPLLPEDYITVGRNLELSHFNPTLVGERITLSLTVEKIDNNRVHLSFIGTDFKGEFCKGKYEKAIVNRDSLIENAIKRAKV